MPDEQENPDAAFEDLPPWSEDEPLPLPRFGRVGPSAPKPLQAPGRYAQLSDTDMERFTEPWQDNDLGVTVYLHKRGGPRGTEIWATVASTHPVGRGLQVSVALLGHDPNRFARRTVRLDEVPQDQPGSCGEACFGTEEAIYGMLGDEVRLDAFLIEQRDRASRPRLHQSRASKESDHFPARAEPPSRGDNAQEREPTGVVQDVGAATEEADLLPDLVELRKLAHREGISWGQLDSDTLRAVAQARELRLDGEPQAVAEILKKPAEARIDAIQKLQGYVDQMRLARGDRFSELDAGFHRCLVRLGGATEDIRDACNVIFKYGRLARRTDEHRRAVCDEHQRIVDALKEGNDSGATQAITAHLRQAYNRWFPFYGAWIVDKNRERYDHMGAGDFLIFSSLNISPVEMSDQQWDPVGKAAAAAVRRGATLLYLRPSQDLLKRWQEKGINELFEHESDMQKEFEAFQSRIAADLSGPGPAADKSEQLRRLVGQRVIQLHIDNEPLFFLTGANRTLGYFHYRYGQDVLTERVPMGDDAAWLIIDSVKKTSLDPQFFLYKVREVLNWFLSTYPPRGDLRQIELYLASKLRPKVDSNPTASRELAGNPDACASPEPG